MSFPAAAGPYELLAADAAGGHVAGHWHRLSA